jgi:hypothetical protein
VTKICPAEAGKVTGMLLEMDNEELLMMLDNEAFMGSKVCVYMANIHCFY